MDITQIFPFFEKVLHIMNTTVLIRYHEFSLTITQLVVSFTVFEILLNLFLRSDNDDFD